jgi:hypothetical protein
VDVCPEDGYGLHFDTKQAADCRGCGSVAALTVFWKFLFQKLEKKKKKNVKWGVAGDRA